MVHGDAVTHPDGVELQRHSPALPYTELDLLGQRTQVHVAGDELVVGVGYADQGPVRVGRFKPERAEEAAVRSPSRTPHDLIAALLHAAPLANRGYRQGVSLHKNSSRIQRDREGIQRRDEDDRADAA